MSKNTKMIWSVDPFEEKSETRSHVISTVQGLLNRGMEIEPVYVLSPDEYAAEIEINSPWLNHVLPNTEKTLDRYVKNMKISGLQSPQVIAEKRPSLTRSIHALISYAKKKKAETILVGTHSKKGISRLVLGSFAETLILYSDVPVLVVGPKSEMPVLKGKKSSSILFSTDFGKAAFPTFKKVLSLAKSNQSKVKIFHCIPHPVEPFIQAGVYLLGGGSLTFPDLKTQNEEKKRKIAAKYIDAAKKFGVEVELQFNSGRGPTADAIVKQAIADRCDLIAMAAQSSPIAVSLMGSVTRQVLRSAHCPVWVMRVS